MILALSETWLAFGSGSGSVHVHDLRTGETKDLDLGLYGCCGVAGRFSWFRRDWAVLSGNWLAVGETEQYRGEDLNGNGVINATKIFQLVDLARIFDPPRFLRGDCNDDGAVDISDAVSTLGSLFLGQGDPGCDDACDSNDDGAVDISDAINTLGVLFLGNGTIPLPGMMECGVDPTEDEVGCMAFSQCP